MNEQNKKKPVIGLEVDFTCPFCHKRVTGFDLNANTIDVRGCGTCGGDVRCSITCPLCDYEIELTVY